MKKRINLLLVLSLLVFIITACAEKTYGLNEVTKGKSKKGGFEFTVTEFGAFQGYEGHHTYVVYTVKNTASKSFRFSTSSIKLQADDTDIAQQFTLFDEDKGSMILQEDIEAGKAVQGTAYFDKLPKSATTFIIRMGEAKVTLSLDDLIVDTNKKEFDLGDGYDEDPYANEADDEEEEGTGVTDEQVQEMLDSTPDTTFEETDETNYGVYESVIGEVSLEGDVTAQYILYDINKDGVKELLLTPTSSEADVETQIYTIADGEESYLGTIYASCSNMYDSAKGVQSFYGQMGYQNIYEYTIVDDSINEELIMEKDIPDGQDYEMPSGKKLEPAFVTDISVLYQ